MSIVCVQSKVMISSGPLVMLLGFHLFSKQIYDFLTIGDYKSVEWSLGQRLFFWMLFSHAFRETFEVLAVKDFTQKPTMGHNILAVRSALSWFWAGFAIPFYTFHPLYTETVWLTLEKPIFFYIAVALFALSELMSLLSVMHLSTVQAYKRLHPSGDPRFFIPSQHGFAHITCANYFWRLCCWLVMACVSQTLMGFCWVVYLFLDLNTRAHKIHYTQVLRYRDLYPPEKRPLIPNFF